MDNRSEVIAGRLTQLGFSQYEARTYIGLLLSNGATGYSVANDTGVPQPKVYETLRRLVERGAAVRTGAKPARHLAVVVDSQWSLWGVAKDGKNWDILTSESPLLAGLVKAYIRHDMFVQQIFADFPAELEARYGSGLLELASLSPTVEPRGADQLEGAG